MPNTEGVRELFYRYDEEDDETTSNSRSNERNFNGGQNRDARNLGRRGENYRRRSRSRSPRGHRNRAHQDNGNGRYALNNGGGSYHHPNMNIAPYMANHVNNNRYSHQDRSGGNFHNYFTHGFHSHLTNQYASHNNNIRCYNCGGLDHIARYCPRS